MRLVIAALASACVSVVVVLASKAADPVASPLAAAGVVGALAIVSSGLGKGGLAVVDPLWTLVLLLRGSVDVWSLLPLLAAQAIGAWPPGSPPGYLVEDLPVLSLEPEPTLSVLAVICAVAGLLVGLLVVAADDGSAPRVVLALPVMVAVVVPVWTARAAGLAPVFAGGVAGVSAWTDVLVASLALAAAVVAGAQCRPPAPRPLN
jgi:hypothetical protein